MKKAFELPQLKLESLQPSEAIMDAAAEGWEIDYFNLSTPNL